MLTKLFTWFTLWDHHSHRDYDVGSHVGIVYRIVCTQGRVVPQVMFLVTCRRVVKMWGYFRQYLDFTRLILNHSILCEHLHEWYSVKDSDVFFIQYCFLSGIPVDIYRSHSFLSTVMINPSYKYIMLLRWSQTECRKIQWQESRDCWG